MSVEYLCASGSVSDESGTKISWQNKQSIYRH